MFDHHFFVSQDGDFGIRIESDILATVAETPYKMLSFVKRGWSNMFASCEMLHVLDVSMIVHIHDYLFGNKALATTCRKYYRAATLFF